MNFIYSFIGEDKMPKVTLVHADWCRLCPAASKLWKSMRSEYEFEYEEVDIDTERGQELAGKHSIMGVPTTIIDDEVIFVGVPEKDEAVSMIS